MNRVDAVNGIAYSCPSLDWIKRDLQAIEDTIDANELPERVRASLKRTLERIDENVEEVRKINDHLRGELAKYAEEADAYEHHYRKLAGKERVHG